MEIDFCEAKRLQEDTIVAGEKIKFMKPTIQTFALNRTDIAYSSALRQCSDKSSGDIGSVSVPDKTVRGESYFFKPISSKVC